MDAETRLAASSLMLVRELPYLAAAVWAVRRVRTPGIGTLSVDRHWRLYYDPAAVSAWSLDELRGVLYHEICHLLREHADRAAMADDSFLWNLAADAEINDDLKKEQVRLPKYPVYPATLRQPEGRLAEEYYAALQRSPSAAATEDGSAGAYIPDPAAATPAGGRCGSAATGVAEAWEGADTAERPCPPGLTPGEAAVIQRRVALAVRDQLRSRGEVAGQWERWAKETLEPAVDWRLELSSLLRRTLGDVAGAVDYSYRRPSRRQPCFGNVLVPSLRQPVPRVAVVVDTSGSISDKMLSQALAEVSGILRAAGQREGIIVLAVDAAVQTCRRVFRLEQVTLAGGGGTDMGEGLEAAASINPRPEIAVVITDGYTPWPERAPRGVRTVAVLLGEGGEAPGWARAVRVPLKDE